MQAQIHDHEIQTLIIDSCGGDIGGMAVAVWFPSDEVFMVKDGNIGKDEVTQLFLSLQTTQQFARCFSPPYDDYGEYIIDLSSCKP